MTIKNEISSLILFSSVGIHIAYNAKNGVEGRLYTCTLCLHGSSSIDINSTIVQNISKVSLHFSFVNPFTSFKLFLL